MLAIRNIFDLKNVSGVTITFLSNIVLPVIAISKSIQKCNLAKFPFINTSYLNDSYIVFTVKMESVFKNTIFGLKMMVKSGLEKIFLKFLHAGAIF